MLLLKKKQKIYKIPGIIMSILLILISNIGIYYIAKTNDFILKSFKKKNVEINSYYLISNYTNLEEIRNGIVGYYENTINIEKAMEETSKKINTEYKSYDDVLFMSNHNAFPSDLPNLFPWESSTSGIVNPYASFPVFFLIKSSPVVILPH